MKTQFIVVLVSFFVLTSVSADVLPATEGGKEGVATMENKPAKTAQEEKNAQTEKPSFKPESIRLPKDFMSPNTVMRRISNDPKQQNHYYGGWGYGVEDACVIFEKRGQGSSDEGIKAEYFFAKLRIQLEKMLSSSKYEILNAKRIEQRLIQREGKPYDVLVFEVTIAFPQNDEKASDLKAGEKRKVTTFKETFWFDISNFFGVGFE